MISAEEALADGLRLPLFAQCSTAFEFTLLTFCPPGPELRAYVNSNSLSGMRMAELTSSVVSMASELYSVESRPFRREPQGSASHTKHISRRAQ